MGEPGVGLGAVPVLDAGAREHDDARCERDGVPALLLVPAGAGRADEDLAAAAGGVVDVPVVAAARGEGDVVDADDALGVGHEVVEEAVPGEVLGVGGVGLALAEDVLGGEGGLVGGGGHDCSVTPRR